MELTLEGEKITRVEPDGSVSPYGSYLCPKGLAAADFHNGEDGRLLASMKRQQDGSFEEITSEKALDEIAGKLGALIAEHGPRSIAVFHGTGAYRSILGGLLEKSFLAATGCPNLFSTTTIDQSSKWITIGRMGTIASGKPGIRDVDLAVITGTNPLVSHQAAPFIAGESGAPGRAFEAAKKRGCRIVVIDPRRTETARYADLFIQPVPGQDAALFAAIAHILLRDGAYDQEFCARHVIQIDELREAVAPFTPGLAASRADVPVEQIELAAKWIGEAKRAMVGSGTGPSFSDHSNLSDHMIEAVNALSGGYRRAGDLVRNPGTLLPRAIREMTIPPTRRWESGIRCHSTDAGQHFGEFPTALLPREITTPGANRIRALVNFGGNPLKALGDPARAIPAFERLELLVSLDARMNDTCRMSHYVVATSQPFERHDLTVSGDLMFPTAFAQYAPPAITKPEGTIHDWAFFWGIAARMNIPLKLKFWTYGLKWEDIPEGMDLSTEREPDPEEMIRFLCRDSAVPFDELKANPSGVRPKRPPQYVEAVPDNGARMEICPPDIASELAEVLEETPDPRLPFLLASRRALEAMNSAYVDARRTRRIHPVNRAYMSPEDMAEAGISDGMRVEIASEHGRIISIVKAERRLRRGVISTTHMFGSLLGSGDPQSDGGSNVGQLTSLERDLQPINYMPRFSGIRVAVRRAESA